MPKLKTKSGVKKRFKLTASGKLKHGVAGKRHRLISHNAKYIRQNRGMDVISQTPMRSVIKKWAPYGLELRSVSTMARRIKRGVTAHAAPQHKRILDAGQGLPGPPQVTPSALPCQAVEKSRPVCVPRSQDQEAGTSAALWIQRINAAVREQGMTYGVFMHGCKLAGIELDRKVMADLAMNEPESFMMVFTQAQTALAKAA